MLYVLIVGLLFIPVWVILRPKVVHHERLFFKGKAIIVSNHWSMADPVLIAFVSPRIIHFMAKAELFQSWIGNLFFRSINAFPVNREKTDLTSMRKAKEVLDAGKVFGIFPEGKRAVRRRLDELEKGAAFMALRCDAPIIPVYTDPETFKRFRIRIIVGEPIHAKDVAAQGKGKPVDVVTEAIRNSLMAMENEMERMRP
ncbi:MAG: 1-acyl-sn-glycerol-3-phosphate acyltransferase [Clostridia bacterium]|nr:1-acyl-sn-glycerol-3-phosphate acyltransferase [Clostridia bacterium]